MPPFEHWPSWVHLAVNALRSGATASGDDTDQFVSETFRDLSVSDNGDVAHAWRWRVLSLAAFRLRKFFNDRPDLNNVQEMNVVRRAQRTVGMPSLATYTPCSCII